MPHPQDHVEFVTNAPPLVALSWLREASIGLSTAVDEHFGINVVEFMVRWVISAPTLSELIDPSRLLAQYL